MTSPSEIWTWKDAFAGFVFVAIGVTAITYSVLVLCNDYSISFWLPGFLLGPVMILLGVGAVIRGIKGTDASEEE